MISAMAIALMISSSQCPHLMACAKCDFYMPKQSSAALLLDGTQKALEFLRPAICGNFSFVRGSHWTGRVATRSSKCQVGSVVHLS